MKPLNNSEARLYAVETRLKETEDRMFNSLAHSKDVLKKLIFALEQENLSTRDVLLSQMVKRSEPNFESFRKIESRQGEEPIQEKALKDKSMDFLFIKRLLYIKHEIDEYQNEAPEPAQTFDLTKPKTPKSLLASRKITQNNSMIVDYQPRVKTTSNRHRRHEYSSMSPLNLFKNKRKGSHIKINSINIKKNMYSNSLISSTESKSIANPKIHMHKLKQRVSDIAKIHYDASDRVLGQDYSHDELLKDSQA